MRGLVTQPIANLVTESSRRGNSTPLTDGASTVLLSTDEWAAEHGLRPVCAAEGRRGPSASTRQPSAAATPTNLAEQASATDAHH